ncbi:hypothetical protein D9M68_371220 [compost metagenome]
MTMRWPAATVSDSPGASTMSSLGPWAVASGVTHTRPCLTRSTLADRAFRLIASPGAICQAPRRTAGGMAAVRVERDREASDSLVQTAVDMMRTPWLIRSAFDRQRGWRSSGMNDRFCGLGGPMKTR